MASDVPAKRTEHHHGVARLLMVVAILYYLLIIISFTLPLVSANPWAYKSNKESFHRNLLFIFFLNLPLNSLVLFVLLDKHVLDGYFMGSKKKRTVENEGGDLAEVDALVSKLNWNNLLKKFVLPSLLITSAGTFIDYYLVFLTPEFLFIGFGVLFLINALALCLIYYSVYGSVYYLVKKDKGIAKDCGKMFVLFNIFWWTMMVLILLSFGNISLESVKSSVFFAQLLVTTGVILLFMLLTFRLPKHRTRSTRKPLFTARRTNTRMESQAILLGLFLCFLLLWTSILPNYYHVEILPTYFHVEDGYPGGTPRAGVRVLGNSTVNYEFKIIDIDTEIELNDTKFYLKDAAGKTVEKGEVWDVLGLNISEPSVNISFNDIDGDLQISSGDHFDIKSWENGGLARDEYTFKIIFKPSGDAVVSRELKPEN